MENTTNANFLENATPHEAAAPLPLKREIQPPEPYPVDVLGDVLGGAARAIHAKIKAPIEICAQSVLAVATLAVQGHADIQLPTGQSRPVSLFFMSIAGSGERKSSCDGEAMLPVKHKEKALWEKHHIDLGQYAIQLEAWNEAKKNAKLKNKKAAHVDEIAKALSAVGEPPIAPLAPVLTCGEPTFEGICRYLMTGQPSIGIFSDEGGQFVGGHAMNEENRLKTAGAFCGLWDGQPIKRVRAGDGTTVLPGRRIAVHLMMQPSVANLMLSNRMLEDQGLLSRFLIAAPPSTIGTRFFDEEFTAQHELQLQTYCSKLSILFDEPLPLEEGKPNELNPRLLTMDDDARQLWRSFADEVERNMAVGGKWEQIRGFANKIPEQAARIAAVLTLVDNLRASSVTGHNMRSGILLAGYYAQEAKRLHEAGYICPDLALAEKTLDWLQNKWPGNLISLPDMYQSGPDKIRNKKTAQKIAAILQSHEWLSKKDGGDVVNGTKRKDVWLIEKRQL